MTIKNVNCLKNRKYGLKKCGNNFKFKSCQVNLNAKF